LRREVEPLRPVAKVLGQVRPDEQDDAQKDCAGDHPVGAGSVIRRMCRYALGRLPPRQDLCIVRRMEQGTGSGQHGGRTPEENAVNTLPLHPAVVHIPLGLAVVMPFLLGAMVWAVVTGRLPGKVWLLALALQGTLLGAAALALRTGEQDEDRVEGRAGESGVEAHERAAQAFTTAAGATFLAAAVALTLRNRRGP